jgi:hypothetical protein
MTTITKPTKPTKPTKLRAIIACGAVTLLLGCTAGTKASNAGSAGNTGAAGSGAGGTTGTGGTTTGTGGGTDARFDITVGDTGSDGVCSSNSVSAEPVPLDLYVTVDISKSLNLTTASGVTKWDAVKSALNAFFADPTSMGIGAGLGFFPLLQNVPATCTTDTPCGSYGPCDRRKTCVAANKSVTLVVPLCVDNTSCSGQNCDLIQSCTDGSYCAADGTATCGSTCMPYAGYCHARDICDATAYATPVVPIAALSGSSAGQAMTLATSLGQHTPDGYTPTAPALKGAIQYTQQYAQAHADHKVAIVLVTDGLPLAFTDYFDPTAGVIHYGFPRTECNPSDIPGIAGIAAGAAKPAAGTPAIPTFVIGVYSSAEGASIGGMLNQIATGGGTAPAVLIDTSTQDVAQVLQTKLAEIRTKEIACDYQLPTSGVSFDKVNVTFTTGGNDVSVGHAGAADGKLGTGCDSRGGWYYDTDYKNDAGTPSKITVCPATCQMFQSDLSGKVNIALGCPTIEVN